MKLYICKRCGRKRLYEEMVNKKAGGKTDICIDCRKELSKNDHTFGAFNKDFKPFAPPKYESKEIERLGKFCIANKIEVEDIIKWQSLK